MRRKTPIALAAALLWGWGSIPAGAQTVELPSDEAIRLQEVTVTSTRTERRVDNVPNTVSVIRHQQIEAEGARDLKDLLKNEIDISVPTGPTRFSAAGRSGTGRAGVEGINIRGLEGNQVLMLVDGVRLPNGFSFASFSTGRGDYVNVDGLQSAEVLRGPASTQFGSDGLAGAVSFKTLDPADLLKKNENFGGFARSSYASVDRSAAATLALAGRNERWQGLILSSHHSGHEVQNKGSNGVESLDRTKPNPVDYSSAYFLGKAYLQLGAAHKLGLTVETQKRKQETEVYSARARAPLAASSTIDLDTRDHVERDRVLLEHHYTDLNALYMQRAQTKLYWQSAQTRQLSVEDRNTSPDRTRDNRYQADVLGLSTLFESNLSGLVNQRLSYGLDWSLSNIKGTRDGTVPSFGEVLPVKPFPDTKYTLFGAFVQSEIERGKLSIIPGLRFDYYKLAPSTVAYTSGAVAQLSDRAVMPRLGFVWRLSPALAPYAQWAQGFRAPTPDQVNTGFSNLASGYTSISNPNLKAEHANSLEMGLRGEHQTWRYSLAAFNNSYKDFISQEVVAGAGTPADPLVFQNINLSRVRIRGLEARTEWKFMPKWLAHAGLSYAKGERESNGVSAPLDSVNPLKAVFGLRYAGGAWTARADMTHSKAKAQSRIAAVTPAQFAPPSYTNLDLGLSWKPAPGLTLNANLNNVFDSKYWRWSDVRGLANNSPVVDAYSASGRNAQISLRYDF